MSSSDSCRSLRVLCGPWSRVYGSYVASHLGDLKKIHTYPQEAMRTVNGSFDLQFVHLIKSTVNNFRVQSSASSLAETEKTCVYSSF